MTTRKRKVFNNTTRKKTTAIRFYENPPEQLVIDGFKFLFLPINNGTFQMDCRVFGGNYLEEKHNSGISHLLEHILTDSWKKCYKKGCVYYLEKYGTKSNAHTMMNNTGYWMRGLSKFKDVMIEYILSITLDPHISTKIMQREIEAVRNEITTLLNRPDYKLRREMARNIFKNKGLLHAADYELQLDNLKCFTTEQLLEFSSKIISTKRVMFVISGDYHKTTIINKIKHILGNLPTQRLSIKIPKCDLSSCYSVKKRVVYVKNDKNKNSIINIVFPVPIYQGNKKLLYLPVLLSLLGGGLNSLLLKQLRLKDKLVYSVNVTSTTNFCGTLININMSTIHKNVHKVLTQTFQVLKKYKSEDVPIHTLKHYKTKYLLNLRSVCLNTTSSVNKFYTHQYFYQIQKKKPIIYTLNNLTTLTKSITPAEIKELLNDLLRTNICSVFYMSDEKVNFTIPDF